MSFLSVAFSGCSTLPSCRVTKPSAAILGESGGLRVTSNPSAPALQGPLLVVPALEVSPGQPCGRGGPSSPTWDLLARGDPSRPLHVIPNWKSRSHKNQIQATGRGDVSSQVSLGHRFLLPVALESCQWGCHPERGHLGCLVH